MSRSENEQEFVLGNRQLLSAFFVVVMLLGVFFAMGYIIGQGSTKKPTQAESAPPVASSASTDATPTPSPAPQTPTPEPEAPPKRTEVAAPVVTEPARTTAEKHAAEREEPTRIESTPTHKYLQVSAVKRPAADSIVRTLKDKGFPALLGESSKPELFRVLVGPYSETEALSKAKTDLKAMGFDAVVSK
jgi:cell division protein FtsN